MSEIHFDTEEDLDAAADQFEELSFDHLHLKEGVEEKRKDLKYAQIELESAEKELAEFREENEGMYA